MNLADHPALKPHVGRPVVMDSNLLLLVWCFRFDPSLLRSFKRLNSFELDDVYLLAETLRLFNSISTTPHVLTEVSNLANSLPEWRKQTWSEFFVNQIKSTPEIYSASTEVASDVAAIRFGITDAALTLLASNYVILTSDWPLANVLASRGLSIVNFNHLRRDLRFS